MTIPYETRAPRVRRLASRQLLDGTRAGNVSPASGPLEHDGVDDVSDVECGCHHCVSRLSTLPPPHPRPSSRSPSPPPPPITPSLPINPPTLPLPPSIPRPPSPPVPSTLPPSPQPLLPTRPPNTPAGGRARQRDSAPRRTATYPASAHRARTRVARAPPRPTAHQISVQWPARCYAIATADCSRTSASPDPTGDWGALPHIDRVEWPQPVPGSRSSPRPTSGRNPGLPDHSPLRPASPRTLLTTKLQNQASVQPACAHHSGEAGEAATAFERHARSHGGREAQRPGTWRRDGRAARAMR